MSDVVLKPSVPSPLSSVCASFASTQKSLADFKSVLNQIESDFNAALNEVLDSGLQADLDKKLDAALAHADSFFASQPIGGFDAAMKDSGLDTTAGTADALIEFGYLYENARVWRVNSDSKTSAQASTSASNQDMVGIGDGDASIEEISELLGRTYVDPDLDTLKSMFRNLSKTSYVVTDSESVTGFESGAGNVAQFRELYRGCGSSLSVLDSFMDHVNQNGFGCVFSLSGIETIYRPASLSLRDFTLEYVQGIMKKSLRDTDVEFRNDVAFVRTETFLGFGISEEEAKQRARVLHRKLRMDPLQVPVVLAKTASTDTSTYVRNNSPVIVTLGCDTTKLGPSCYRLGLGVNGIYRVVDVTTDQGSNVTGEYTANSVASAISGVFGDFVEVSSTDTEIVIALRSGLSSYGSLAVFWAGDQDCSEALGVRACVAATAKALGIGGVSSTQEVVWVGGASSAGDSIPSGLLSFVVSSIDYAKTSLISRSSYYQDLDLSKKIEALASKCASVASSPSRVLETYYELGNVVVPMSFFDAGNTSLQDYRLLRTGLTTSGFETVLRSRPDIYDIDPYSGKDTVAAGLRMTMNELKSADAVTTANTAGVKYTMPYGLNSGYASRLQLLAGVAITTDDPDDIDAYCEACRSTLIAQQAQHETMSGTVTYSRIISGMDSVLQAINSVSDSRMQSAVWAAIRAVPGVTTAIAGTRVAQRALDDAANALDSGVESLESLVGNIASALGLDEANRFLLTLLIELDAALKAAIVMAQKTSAIYNASMAKAIALSNFTMNFSGSLGFDSKYLKCYVSGSVSGAPLASLVSMLAVINELADDFNKFCARIKKMLQVGIDDLLCMIDAITEKITGQASFEKTMVAGGAVFTMQCTVTGGIGLTLDPGVLHHVTSIRNEIGCLLDCLKLQVVTFQKHDQNMQAASQSVSAGLESTLEDIKSKLRAC